jgi:hypothetical protein
LSAPHGPFGTAGVACVQHFLGTQGNPAATCQEIVDNGTCDDNDAKYFLKNGDDDPIQVVCDCDGGGACGKTGAIMLMGSSKLDDELCSKVWSQEVSVCQRKR